MKFIKIFLALLCALSFVSSIAAQQSSRKVFPYNYTVDDLPNGLRVVTVPTDYPNLVSLYTVVGAGSRNEVEANKSGYAHFFEHLMFRGSENFPAGRFDEVMKKAGASSNAYTTDDRTVYHATFAKEDLDEIMRLEADRFQRLKFTEEQFKTEAGAVLGEYNKNSASPTFKMYEVLRETAFQNHTYKHTTMGFLADIQDYPNQYDYAWQFFNRFYRPENTTIVVVGDVKRPEVVQMVKNYWGNWQPGTYKQQIPVEPQQKEARSKHVDWASQTLPYVMVAYRAPAFSETAKDKAALDLLSVVAFGENSDLYQRLVLKEQKVEWIYADMENHIDPELITVTSKVKNRADLNYVRDEIIKTYKRFAMERISQNQLDETRSRMRYSFALGMNSNDAIAGTLAQFVALRRSPDTIDKVFALYDSITPEDIRFYAEKYFKDNSQTVITLATKEGVAK
jgi:zinc protease